MQPQQFYPPAPATEPPPMAPAIMTTDQMIAQENARIFVFEHGPPEIKKRHKGFEFLGLHKSAIITGATAFLLILFGTFFAYIKIQAYTKSVQSQASTAESGSNATISGGGAVKDDVTRTSADTSDVESTDTEEDMSSVYDEEGDSEYTDYYEFEDTGEYEDVYDESYNEDNTEPTDTTNVSESVSIPAPSSVPVVPTPTITHKFTAASWNSNDDNDLVVGDQIKSIMSKTQILGVQEVDDTSQRSSISSKVTCSNCAYAGYLASYSSGTASASSYPIIWDKTSFSQIGSGSSRKMCESASTSRYTYPARYATWVKLQSKVSGKQLYVINTQFMGGVESSGKPKSDTLLLGRYKTQMTNLVSLINELKAANIPIYIAGTFNVNYRYDHTVKTSYFPYISLGALDVRSNWDLLNLSGISSSAGTQGTGNRLIDYVFSWQRSDVTPNSTAISSSRYGSDQSVVFYTSTIK